jgi:hypothetical protein
MRHKIWLCVATLLLSTGKISPVSAQAGDFTLLDCTVLDSAAVKAKPGTLKPEQYRKLYFLLPAKASFSEGETRFADKSGILGDRRLVHGEIMIANGKQPGGLKLFFSSVNNGAWMWALMENRFIKGSLIGAIVPGEMGIVGGFKLNVRGKPDFSGMCGLNPGPNAVARFEERSK